MAFQCLELGDSLYQNGSGELEVQLATGSGLEIIVGEGLSLEDDQKTPTWFDWTPTFTNLSGGTLDFARYLQTGKLISFRWQYTLGGAGVSGPVSFTLPVTTHISYSINSAIGIARLNDATSVDYFGEIEWLSSTSGVVVYTGPPLSNLSSVNPFVWANNDVIGAWGSYEAV